MNPENLIAELVIYHVKEDPAAYRQVLLHQTSAGLATLPGYHGRRVYQAVNDPCVLVDFVSWDTLANAVAAAKAMPQVAELAPFMKLIARTDLFDHFRRVDSHGDPREEAAAVEWVAYQLKPEHNARSTEFYSTYSRELAQAPGYLGRTLWQSATNEALWVERVHWRDAAAAAANELAMRNNSVLHELFSLVEAVRLMQVFCELT